MKMDPPWPANRKPCGVSVPMSSIYRANAFAQQDVADRASLANVRALHEGAAKKWHDLADRALRFECARRRLALTSKEQKPL